MNILKLLKRPKHERRRILAGQAEIMAKLNRIEARLGGKHQPSDLPVPVYVGGGAVLAETFFGRKIYVDGHDSSLTPHIIREGRWEQWLTDFILRELKPGQTFVDIGANCGFYALLAAHIVGDTGTVVAIEPQQRLAKLVQRSFFMNGFDSYAHCLQIAIGETTQPASLEKSDFLTGSASIAGVGNLHDSSETVMVKPLDAALKEARAGLNRKIVPDVIKIDSEGYEWLIWQGARDYFATCDKLLICLEFSPMRYHAMGDAPSAFIDRIIADGFTVSMVEYDGTEKKLSASDIRKIAAVQHGHTDLVLRKGYGA